MGIAGFFLWLKQYYSQCIDNIPQSVVDDALKHKASPDSIGARYRYDNLYIDMNGLLHPCCHDTFPLPEPKNEEEMFSRLFDQLDLLVKVVRPRKCLVLCVDGVAPRSKMNQQRIRRFQGVAERAETDAMMEECADQVEKALHLPRPEVRKKWDHNVITPATEFMDRMGVAVEWYILKKLNDDPAWRHLSVVYSDAHVPGEGEHKIMQYIRGLRTQPGYQPSTSHVIHGMDADLICLGLSLHEEHVSVLRNQLTETFQPDHNRFCYLNLHTYRAALREDFANIKDMDFERVLDDFVYMCFFVGNDFLPHIPLISIKTQGIELLLDHYVRNFDDHGYLTDRGTVDFARLAVFLKKFVGESMEKLRGAYHGVERAKRRAHTNVQSRLLKARRVLGKLSQYALATTCGDAAAEEGKGAKSAHNPFAEEGDDEDGLVAELEIAKTMAEVQQMDRTALAQQILSVVTDMKKEQSRFVADRQPLPFSYLADDYREQYYKQKFGWDAEEIGVKAFEKKVHRCCAEYFRGTQWVMWYYTRGCPSWAWFYPYHYAPLIQDLAAFEGKVNIKMEMSAPLHPFEQLLAVLPRESVHGLPKVFHKPVLDPKSALGQFYPDDFDVDITEANFSYQGVLRLPFIDCDSLHKAVGKIAVVEPDRPVTIVFCHEKSALARQVKANMPQLLSPDTSKSNTIRRNSEGEDPATVQKLLDEENDRALVAISKDMAGEVPIAGRLGPCPNDRTWPSHAKVTCPDEGLAKETSYGKPIVDNKALALRYEMIQGQEYRPQLLAAGGRSRVSVADNANLRKGEHKQRNGTETVERKKETKSSQKRSRSSSPARERPHVAADSAGATPPRKRAKAHAGDSEHLRPPSPSAVASTPQKHGTEHKNSKKSKSPSPKRQHQQQQQQQQRHQQQKNNKSGHKTAKAAVDGAIDKAGAVKTLSHLQATKKKKSSHKHKQ